MRFFPWSEYSLYSSAFLFRSTAHSNFDFGWVKLIGHGGFYSITFRTGWFWTPSSPSTFSSLVLPWCDFWWWLLVFGPAPRAAGSLSCWCSFRKALCLNIWVFYSSSRWWSLAGTGYSRRSRPAPRNWTLRALSIRGFLTSKSMRRNTKSWDLRAMFYNSMEWLALRLEPGLELID